MSSRILVSALAVVAAITIVAALQDPSFEYPAAKHAGFDAPKVDTFSIGYQASEKVSVSFKNATVREVLDWLKDQGINFVVPDDQVNKDSRININVVNEPVETLMRALAGAWNGHWERNKEIWVFKKGRGMLTEGNSAFGEGGNFKVFASPDGQSKFQWFMDPNTPMTKEQKELFEKAMKNQDPKAWEEFSKTWQGANGKLFEYKMDPKKIEEMQKQAEKMAKSGVNGYFWNGKDLKPFDEKQMREMQKMGKKGFLWNGKDFKPFDEKMVKEMQKNAEKMATDGSRIWLKDGNVFRTDGKRSFPNVENLKAIYESLTPTQEQLLKTNGYLHYSDLNSKQRALLGVIQDDGWSISYKTDKIDITIKSDH